MEPDCQTCQNIYLDFSFFCYECDFDYSGYEPQWEEEGETDEEATG